jgi:hypothetical protein
MPGIVLGVEWPRASGGRLAAGRNHEAIIAAVPAVTLPAGNELADDLAVCSAADRQSGEPALTRTRDLLHITKALRRDRCG